jgi:hypothetical protein
LPSRPRLSPLSHCSPHFYLLHRAAPLTEDRSIHGNHFLPAIAAHLHFAVFSETGSCPAYFPWLVGRFLFQCTG